MRSKVSPSKPLTGRQPALVDVSAFAALVPIAAMIIAAMHATELLASPVAAPGRQVSSETHAYIPLAIHGLPIDGLERPSTTMPSPTPSDTPTPEPEPTEPPCGDLPERISVTAIDVSPVQVRVGESRSRMRWPVYMVPRPDGAGAKIGWSDDEGAVRVTTTGADGLPALPDAVMDGDGVRGLVAHADGGTAMLRVRGKVLALVRLDRQGEISFAKDLVGLRPETEEGSKWVDNWGHEGRLVWADERYGAYFGHTQYFDAARGKHQGDLLWFFDGDGERLTDREVGGWNWGCSHSLDLRLAHNGTRWGAVCLSDAYPTKGFHLNHREREIRPEPSGDMAGRSDARLGGWVPLSDGFLMSFASPEERTSTDVGLIHVANDATISAVRWLTETPDVNENAPHLARYGPDHFLASWTADDALTLAVVARDGAIVEGPATVDAHIGARDDMVALPGGDVGWAYAWDTMSELKVARVRYCE